MKKYLAIYYSPAEAMEKMATATPEEKMAGMAPWMAWKEKAGNAIVDFGAPLMGGQGTADGNNWSNSNKEVSGYGIVEAESMDAAKELFKDHPHLPWHPDTKIGIYEMVNMG